MNSFGKLCLSLTSLMMLTGCKQTISEESFLKRISSLEEHQYQTAVVTYQSKGKEEKDNFEIVEAFTWNNENGVWESEEKTPATLSYLICLRGKEEIFDEINGKSEFPQGSKYKVTYYSDFSFTGQIKNVTVVSWVMTTSGCFETETQYNFFKVYMKFDKYGFMTNAKTELDLEIKTKIDDYISEGTTKGKQTITIKYE